MVKFTVIHSCGHEATHGFSGSEPERQRREDWLRTQLCQTCWRAGQADAAATCAGEWNLPPLEGRDEDRSWAEVIRVKAMAHNKEFHGRVTDNRKFGPDQAVMKQTVVAAADEALRELENQTSATWWIENRFEVLSYVKCRVTAAVATVFDARR